MIAFYFDLWFTDHSFYAITLLYEEGKHMGSKHHWTFEEDLYFCNKYLDFFVVQKSNMSLSDFCRLLLSSKLTEISFNSAKLKVQNIKGLLTEYNISDSLKTAPARNYSKQNAKAMEYALKERGLK